MFRAIGPVLSFLALLLAPATATRADGPVHSDGTQVQCDLPVELRMFNVGGSDGAGLCVYSSVTMAANFQGDERLFGLRKYAEKRPGGSWPEKLEKDRANFAPEARLLQVTGADLPFIKLCLANGYMLSTTWGSAHMTNCVHADDKWWVTLDNNSAYEKGPDGSRKDTRLIWTPVQKGYQRAAGGRTWIVVVLDRGPPSPVPVNSLSEARPWKAPRLEWRSRSGGHFVYRDRYLAGALRNGMYQSWDRRARCYANEDTPPPAGARDHGCYWDGPVGADPRFTLNGKTISRQEAEALVTRTRTWRRLSIVGDTSLRNRVLSDLHTDPELVEAAKTLVVQPYNTASPLARGVGLAPGISIQAPPDAAGKGRVLARLRTYDGPRQLASALRQADPNYRPDRDPDPTKPRPLSPNVIDAELADFTPVIPLALGGILAALLGLPDRRRSPPPPTVEHELWIL